MVSTVAGELELVVPAVASAAGASSTVSNEISTALTSIQQGAQALATADAAETAQPIIDRVMNDFETVLSTLAQVALPAPIATVARIAQIMVPTIQAVAALVWPSTPAVTQPPPSPAPAAA